MILNAWEFFGLPSPFHLHFDPDLPMNVQESPVEAWVGGSLVQGRGHWV